MTFDNFINWAMSQAGITNYKLAKRIGVSQTTVANWANGITEPRERRREEVLKLFGVDESDLEIGFPEIHYMPEDKKEKPAPEGELNEELISRLISLTPEEVEKVDAFVQGLLAAR